MTTHDHRRPCRRCGHDERSHSYGYAACSVVVRGRKYDPFCPCPGYLAMGDAQPAAGRNGEGES